MSNSPAVNRDSLLPVRTIHILLLVLLTSLVFSNTLENGYHLDSIPRVKNNTEIDHFWPPTRFFTDIRTGSTIPQIAEYRPMMPLSHALDSEIARLTGIDRLAVFHAGNIAIHATSVVLVYFLFCLLIGRWDTPLKPANETSGERHKAFAAALIFAVHPISGSAVNYIAARDLLLMVLFFVASMLVYFHMRMHRERLSAWLLSLLLLCLAILSKQVAILGFALVFLFEWVLAGSKLTDWKLWARTAIFSLPTAVYFLVRWLWISVRNPADTLRTFTDMGYPLTMLDAHLSYYLRNFAWPFEMRALARFDMVDSILHPGALAGLSVILASFVAAWWLRRSRPLISFAILAYWLLFSLTASVFPFRYVVTDYRQYLPLVFLALVTSLACFTFRSRLLSSTLVGLLVIYFAVSSFHMNRHWQSETSFWKQSVRYGGVALAHSNYGLSLATRDPELAEKHFLAALDQNPVHIYASINLGMLYLREGKPEQGLDTLRRVVELNPDWALAHYWLSTGLKQLGRGQEALDSLQSAADLDPRSLKYQYEAGSALQTARDFERSARYLQRVVDIDPDYRQAGFMLGFAFQKQGDNMAAIRSYTRFLKYRPEHVQTHFNLAYAYMQQGSYESAVTHFARTLLLKPEYQEVHLHLSRCYKALGDSGLSAYHAGLYRQP